MQTELLTLKTRLLIEQQVRNLYSILENPDVGDYVDYEDRLLQIKLAFINNLVESDETTNNYAIDIICTKYPSLYEVLSIIIKEYKTFGIDNLSSDKPRPRKRFEDCVEETASDKINSMTIKEGFDVFINAIINSFRRK